MATSTFDSTHRDRRVGSRRARIVGAVYYGGFTLLMILILSNQLRDFLPAGVARRVGYNSEGYTLAILLGGWIQFVLPRLSRAAKWPVTLGAAALSLAIALLLYAEILPSQYSTLNESFFALVLVLPYVTLTRPLRGWPPLASLAILVAVVLGVQRSPVNSPVVLLAETMAVFILLPIGLDVVDRGILDRAARTVPALRYAWYALLVVVPVTVVLLGNADRVGGGIHAVLEYIGRVHEGVIAVLAVQLYFAVGLRRTGRPAASNSRPGG